MSASSVETIELWIWSCRLERTGARPSISSKKMIDGCKRWASSKSIRNWRSVSPTHLLKQSAPFRMKNEMLLLLGPICEQQLARALATSYTRARATNVPLCQCTHNAMWISRRARERERERERERDEE
mgnify:CR=1 FL=1